MVNYAFQPDDTPITLPDESEKLSTKIKLGEVMEGGGGIEASAFSLEARNICSEEADPNKIDLTQIKYDTEAIPIWEMAAQLSAKVLEEEWAKVPADLAQRFDYYQGVREDS